MQSKSRNTRPAVQDEKVRRGNGQSNDNGPRRHQKIQLLHALGLSLNFFLPHRHTPPLACLTWPAWLMEFALPCPAPRMLVEMALVRSEREARRAGWDLHLAWMDEERMKRLVCHVVRFPWEAHAPDQPLTQRGPLRERPISS